VLIAASLTLSICFSDTVSEYAKYGLSLSYNLIIPVVFPYMILSDLLLSYVHLEGFTPLSHSFSRIFKISPRGIGAYISGLICGFPTGVKLGRDLYLSGMIDKDECERLICFSCNPSPAFLIGGIGFSIRGSVCDGVILLIANLIASITLGAILSLGKHSSHREKCNNDKYSFSLTSSIKDAAINTLSTCGFITFFSIIIGIVRTLIPSDAFIITLSTLLEISNATSFIANSSLPPRAALSLAAFAASSSGISVLLQSKNLLIGTDISMKYYIPARLLTGSVSAFITFIACTIL